MLPTRERFKGTEVPVRSKHGRTSNSSAATCSSMLSGGGGGLGDPLLRDAAARSLEDVADDYITADHARAIYGVVARRRRRRSTTAATRPAARRSARERIGGEPGARRCSRRKSIARLGRARERRVDLRLVHGAPRATRRATGARARLVEQPIAERYAELGM